MKVTVVPALVPLFIIFPSVALEAVQVTEPEMSAVAEVGFFALIVIGLELTVLSDAGSIVLGRDQV